MRTTMSRRRSPRARRARLGGALAVGLLIAGCGAGPRDAADSASGASTQPAPASPSATPTSTPPTSPPPTSPKEQALATVREYFDAANYAIQTGDTRRIRAVTDPGCPCFALVRSLEKVHARGQRMPDAQFIVDSLAVTDLTGNVAGISAQYHAPAYAVLNREGQVVEKVTGHRQTTHFTTVLFAGRWRLTQSFRLDKG